MTTPLSAKPSDLKNAGALPERSSNARPNASWGRWRREVVTHRGLRGKAEKINAAVERTLQGSANDRRVETTTNDNRS